MKNCLHLNILVWNFWGFFLILNNTHLLATGTFRQDGLDKDCVGSPLGTLLHEMFEIKIFCFEVLDISFEILVKFCLVNVKMSKKVNELPFWALLHIWKY